MLLQGGYLVEPSAGIFFHAPTFGEHVNQATTLPPPQKTSAPQPDSTNLLFMSLLAIFFKCSKPRKNLQALSSKTKVKLSEYLLLETVFVGKAPQ
jgi:hypothetical protein